MFPGIVEICKVCINLYHLDLFPHLQGQVSGF